MGDIIELTTSPSHSNIFYKLTSSGIIFEVKGALNAAVGLAKRPGSYCDVWVLIGMNNQICIKKDQGGKTCRTQNAITPTAYRRYWLSWKNGSIQLGHGSERNPLISYPNDILLSYITFSASGPSFHALRQAMNLVHWRVELPPILEKPKIMSVTGGELQWLHVDNQLPDGALIGGFENETLYIIRATHQGSLTPGKFVPSQGTAYISWGGNEHEKENFDVLCGFDCTWVPTSEDKIPVGAVEAGYSEDARGDKLYVGRATHCGHLIPGKVQPSHKVCYIPYGGREIAMKKYEILVCQDTNSRCANRLFIYHIPVASPPDSDEEDHHYFDNVNYNDDISDHDDDDILIDHAF